jgi:hypothetical protein
MVKRIIRKKEKEKRIDCFSNFIIKMTKNKRNYFAKATIKIELVDQ